jgi:bifunctional UDP-N-acetylglucosamine pyrophosphorylase/glucosamine-1-phosphate N-acetyltransferase
MSRPETVVILAAGQGTRMKLGRPKVLAPLCGRAMVEWVVDQALALDPKRVIVVVGHGADEVRATVAAIDPRVSCVVQEQQLGTGHALQVCLPELGEDPGRVVLLYGDMPLLTTESLEQLCAAQAATGGGMAMLTSEPENPRGFGRVLRDGAGGVRAIVEEKDATPEQRDVREVNLGVYAFDGTDLVRVLPTLSNDNAQGEYYVTDVVGILVEQGRAVSAVVLADEAEAIGVNTCAHLAEARAELQMRILTEHMENGVRIEDPATTYIDHGVTIGAGTEILPCTVIRSGVTIGARCKVGPFSHLRVETVIEDGAEIGNFTEAKKSRLGAGAKAKHLSYLGDAIIGAEANIGAGTIFANYDGKAKHASTVGEGSFVGSGTILVAPATIGDGATTGAGAVVTRGSAVPAGDVWVGVPARPIHSAGKRETEGSPGA